jgi:uncharacterized membrane protein
MSHKKHSNKHDNREQKREQFTAPAPSGKKSNSTSGLIFVAIALLGIVFYVVVSNRGGDQLANGASAARQTSAAQLQADANGDVVIPVSELSNKAHFYEYRTAGNQLVRFFAIKSSDGVYRAALDACDVCFAAKKGYKQSGDDMVCQKCGNHFPSTEVNDVSGGCNPVGLNRQVVGDHLVFKAKDLESKTGYF